MDTYDFHGLTIDQAEQKLDRLISKYRSHNKRDLVKLITGHGKIRGHFLKILKEIYKLDCHIDISNNGCIIVLIE